MSNTYDDFESLVERITNLYGASMVLSWDQEVMMPTGGTPARSKQKSAISAVEHDLLTSDEMASYLAELRDADLSAEQAAVVREVGRRHDRAMSVPTDLVERISESTSNAHPVWKSARENEDFDEFAPALSEIVELKREYAAAIDPDRDPYEVLFEDYEPYLGLDTADRILDELRDALVPLIDEIRASEADIETNAFDGTYPESTQEAVVRDILDALGFPWDHGRLDPAPHPFSTGSPFDARITTRYDESRPLDAISSAIHEFGHATYTLGLPREHYGTPLGQNRDLSVHESQSRLWENHVGRSRAFWEHALPIVKRHFDGTAELTVEDVYETANQVFEENYIRVQADELTYHMHIVVRFEIEKALIAGDLDVADVPAAWNDKMEAYLGIRPPNDRLGCLQDIHWSHGSFGYFSTYSLGSVLAAQVYAAADREIEDLDGAIRDGEFDPLRDWTRETIHRHGQFYTTPALIEHATGEPFTAEYFVEYVTEKYRSLYGLD